MHTAHTPCGVCYCECVLLPEMESCLSQSEIRNTQTCFMSHKLQNIREDSSTQFSDVMPGLFCKCELTQSIISPIVEKFITSKYSSRKLDAS